MSSSVNPLQTGELPQVSPDDTGGPPRPRRFKRSRITLKLLAFVAVVYFGLATVIPGVRKAMSELSSVNPALLLLGFALQIAALLAYSLLSIRAMGADGEAISAMRMFRIQLSTKALSSIVPGGSAAGSALGYRLITMSGVPGPAAGFSLATAGLGSAVMLNLIFWVALMISIPIRGVNPGYATAAIAGVVLMVVAGAVVFSLAEGRGRAERIVRWVARKLKLSEDRAAAGVRQVSTRLDELASDKPLLMRVAFWAAMNWLLDIASLWVFLRAFGAGPDVDALVVGFGLVNVLAVIPITPGGLGIIDGGLPLAMVGFGMARSQAVLGTATYRLAQYFFPIILGAVMYASLRVGPFAIDKRERLGRLRDIAATSGDETNLDFSARFHRRELGLDSPRGPGGAPAEGDGDDDYGS
ncbi:MAG TPA: lysylphosphatidylglycerol synthase transmembrane domain-containing protein [Ilumatobacteraceae bacterium]|nr:lysylphosphatidylglycerol synthase transmembrane domain-containing protein [Ilumatobacteraceae bacterium]